MDFFNKASKKFAQVQKKTGDSITIYKLQGQIKDLNEEIAAMYTEIGMACYKAHKAGEAAEGLSEKFEAVASIEAAIAQLSEEIDRINNVTRCPGCESVVERGVRYCPNCGTRMPEPPAPQEPEIELCPDCGIEREGSARYCEFCGHCFVTDEAPEAEEAIAGKTEDAVETEDSAETE